jgi:hypothetical protein
VLRVHTPCCRVHDPHTSVPTVAACELIALLSSVRAVVQPRNRPIVLRVHTPCCGVHDPHTSVPTVAACELIALLSSVRAVVQPRNRPIVLRVHTPAAVSTTHTHLSPRLLHVNTAPGEPLSGLLCSPETGQSCYVFTHPAAVSMPHTCLSPRLLYVNGDLRGLFPGCCAAQKQANRVTCSHTLLPCP